MPSPVGHVLAGATAGLLVTATERPRPRPRRAVWTRTAAFAMLGAAPDLDLLIPVAHRAASHGIGMAIVVGVLAAGATRSWRLAVAAASAYASHILLDWVGTDTSPPYGVMALWPVSHAYYESSVHAFHAISRRWGTSAFWVQNLRALARELLLLLPPFLAVLWATLAWRGRAPPGAGVPASPSGGPGGMGADSETPGRERRGGNGDLHDRGRKSGNAASS